MKENLSRVPLLPKYQRMKNKFRSGGKMSGAKLCHALWRSEKTQLQTGPQLRSGMWYFQVGVLLRKPTVVWHAPPLIYLECVCLPHPFITTDPGASEGRRRHRGWMSGQSPKSPPPLPVPPASQASTQGACGRFRVRGGSVFARTSHNQVSPPR